MSQLAEVHTLYKTNCRSIPDMLRTAAESLETEEAEGFSRTVAMAAIQLTEDGQVQIYGWGDTSDLHCLGLMQRGVHKLLTTLEDQEQC